MLLSRFGWSLIALLTVLVELGSAGDALQRIPENVQGFVYVRDLADASGKVEQLLEAIDVTFPAPLALGKLVTGLDEGLETSGNLVVALLSGETSQAPLQPLVLLPVSDYEAFANSINADTSGEICRAALRGEDILVARDGDYALLMNVEHRATMEELVALPPEPLPELTPIASWLPRQDVAVVLTRQGIVRLKTWKPQPNRRSAFGLDPYSSPSVLEQALAMISVPETVGWLSSNVEVAALGATVDRDSNLRFDHKLLLQRHSPLANVAWTDGERRTSQLGLSDEPSVFAASGSLAPNWGQSLARRLSLTGQPMTAKGANAETVAKLRTENEAAYRLLLDKIDSVSVVMLHGEKGEPLLSNFFWRRDGARRREVLRRASHGGPNLEQVDRRIHRRVQAGIPTPPRRGRWSKKVRNHDRRRHDRARSACAGHQLDVGSDGRHRRAAAHLLLAARRDDFRIRHRTTRPDGSFSRCDRR